jgi:hypothetical protein
VADETATSANAFPRRALACSHATASRCSACDNSSTYRRTSIARPAALDARLDHDNFTRPHDSLKPPGSRLTNLPGNDS